MFGTGDLGEVEAGQLRELASGQARILTDLAEPTAECLLGALRLIGHVTSRRLLGRPVVLVRDSERPHRLERRRAQLDVTTISGGGEVDAGPVARVVVKDQQEAVDSQKSLPGNAMDDTRRRGIHRMSVPASTCGCMML